MCSVCVCAISPSVRKMHILTVLLVWSSSHHHSRWLNDDVDIIINQLHILLVYRKCTNAAAKCFASIARTQHLDKTPMFVVENNPLQSQQFIPFNLSRWIQNTHSREGCAGVCNYEWNAVYTQEMLSISVHRFKPNVYRQSTRGAQIVGHSFENDWSFSNHMRTFCQRIMLQIYIIIGV